MRETSERSRRTGVAEYMLSWLNTGTETAGQDARLDTNKSDQIRMENRR
jgi:hypothetical protein